MGRKKFQWIAAMVGAVAALAITHAGPFSASAATTPAENAVQQIKTILYTNNLSAPAKVKQSKDVITQYEATTTASTAATTPAENAVQQIKTILYTKKLSASAKVKQSKDVITQYEATTTTTTTTTPPTSTSTTSSTTTTTTPVGCDLNATPNNFAAQVGAAVAGQTVCLATGSYPTFTGVAKNITIAAASGAQPSMRFNLGSGDSGFTLDGLVNTGGNVTAGAHDITIRNSTFNTYLDFQSGPTPNFVIDNDTFNNINSPQGTPNARVGLHYGSSGFSGVTVKNSTMIGGDSDGVHTGVGVNVLNNTMRDICGGGYNHADFIQFEGAVGGRIAGNLIQSGPGCEAQGITSYDGGTQGVVVEDNVVDIRRQWGIEFYADDSSIIRHNTVVYHGGNCYFNQACGDIDITHKSIDPPGHGTQVYDNIAAVDISGSTVARNDHNYQGPGVLFVGGASPATYAGFHLAAGSVGKGGASDGSDAGIR